MSNTTAFFVSSFETVDSACVLWYFRIKILREGAGLKKKEKRNYYGRKEMLRYVLQGYGDFVRFGNAR